MRSQDKVITLCFFCLFILLLCWVEIHCGFYKSSYTISKYHTWILLLHDSHLSWLPHSWNSFNTYYFLLTYMCTRYLFHSHPPIPFPYLLPPSHWYLLIPGRTSMPSWFSAFVKERKMTFFVLESYTGVFLLCFFKTRSSFLVVLRIGL
jgi:hypothetical protein